MGKNNVPIKVAIGYGVVAIVFIMAIYLVYSNTQSILNINKASQEYSHKRDVADSLMSNLLQEERMNLQQLTQVYRQDKNDNFLHQKVVNLNSGKDSVLVHSKAALTHQAQKTTVEVVKTRKGFFKRLADAFKKEHIDTLSITQDSNLITTDSVTTPIDVADKVANVLAEISKEEKKAEKGKDRAISKEIADLQMVNAQLALRSNQQMNDLRQKEKASLQQALDQAVKARKALIWQISLLAIIAMIAAVVLLLYIWRDTKKERIYRENLERAKEETLRIMEQRERLLLTITHDIKAPAASISGFIDLLKEYVYDKQAIAYINNIHSSAQHLSQLVGALLDYHQLENGQMELHPVSFNLNTLISQCVESMRLRAEDKGLKIHYQIKNTLKNKDDNTAMMLRGDAFRIRQIMDNLVSNAIKYTAQGSIYILAQIKEKTDADNTQPQACQLILMVKDTGCGMTTEESQKVFGAFTRLKEAQGIEGVGLGLSITHELVTLLNGEIHLQSEKNKGTNFTVVLPIEKTFSQQDKEIPTSSFANHKILILDDDSLQLQLLQAMLKRITSDWTVYTCNHVSDALTILHDKQPALMMMDIEMPEMNGINFIKHINHHHMTVIAMTAHDASIKPQLQEAGFDGCLFKPFRIEKLEEILGIESKGITDNQLTSLLAFAEGDTNAEQEILSNLQKDLDGYHQIFQEVLAANTLNKKVIAQSAHKLLPIATMLQFSTIPQIQKLSPEHIQEQEVQKIRAYLKAIITDLESMLGKVKRHL